MVTKARKAALKSYPLAMLAEKLQAAAMRWDTDEVAAINAEMKRRKKIQPQAVASDRPGDAAAVLAQETGMDYSAALVACNMD